MANVPRLLNAQTATAQPRQVTNRSYAKRNLEGTAANELRHNETHMAKLPDFELAPLKDFDPNTFNSSAPSVDAFVLSLALAFNDFKGLEWWATQLEKGDPKEAKVSPYHGQFNGMRIQVTRLSLASVHELLQAIAAAHKNHTVEHPAFVQALDIMTPASRANWEDVVAVVLGRDARHDKVFLNWLVRLRNNAAFHYYQPKALHGGYKQYFAEAAPSDHNRFAYASLGKSSEASRFYFADAAVGAVYDDEELIAAARALRRPISILLYTVVEAYLYTRNRKKLPKGHPARLPLRKPRF